jgi:hypothetical protein
VLDRPALGALFGEAISRGCRHRAGSRNAIRPKRLVTRSSAFSPTTFDLD